MALIGINPGGPAPERKPSTLEQIAMGVQIAANVLGTGLQAYKVFGIDKPQADAEVRLKNAQAADAGGDKALERDLKMSQIMANTASTNASTQVKRRELALPSLTPGQTEVDKVFGKEYSDYVAAGGFAGVQKNLEQLNTAKQVLERSSDISGPMIGLQPDALRKRTNPQSAAVQRDIEDSVQASLRATLGPQFTEREGTQILRRAFDPSVSEKENARRVETLIKQIERTAAAKQKAADYYEQNGTLKGFKGQTHFSAADLGASDSKAPSESGASETVLVISPNGQKGTIPKSQLEDALNHGYRAAE